MIDSKKIVDCKVLINKKSPHFTNSVILKITILPLLLFLLSCKKNKVEDENNCNDTGFEKTYGGENDDFGNSLVILNKAIYLLGTTLTKDNKEDLFLIKTDLNGLIIWEKTFGGESEEFSYEIIKTREGNLLLTGSTKSYGNGGKDAFLVKIDPDGEVIWEKTFGDAKDDYLESLKETDDGEVLMLGTTESKGQGGRDVYFLKIDSEGNVLWEKTFGGAENDGGSEIAVGNDGSIILFGYTESFGSDNGRDYYLLNVNEQGDTLFTKTYGGKGYEESQSIKNTKDGGFILNGHSSSTDIMHNMYAIKINAEGKVTWDENFGGTQHDGGHSVIQNSQGNFILVGRSNSFGSPDQDIYVVKTNEIGKEIETKIIGGDEYERGNEIIEYNGFYYLIGETKSMGKGEKDLYLVKFSL